MYESSPQDLERLEQMQTQNSTLVLPGGRDPLEAKDLRHLFTQNGEVNDALMNYFVDICQRRPQSFYEFTKIEPPPQHRHTNYLVVTSFLYPSILRANKLTRAGDLSHENEWERIMRWHSNVSNTGIPPQNLLIIPLRSTSVSYARYMFLSTTA